MLSWYKFIGKRMQFSVSRKWLTLSCFCFLSLCCFSMAYPYQHFEILKESVCQNVEHKDMLKLPSEWQKYASFVKKCPLIEKKGGHQDIFILSIWTDDYFRSKFPGRIPVWENFPLPLIVDDHFKKIGELPEMYPTNDITSPDIYYGVWKDGIPTEIRVDVSNPAVDGDYYYPPLRWDPQKRLYRMLHGEVKYGRRR